METLDAINQREEAIRERAWQYQQVLGAISNLTATIARLTPQLEVQAKTMELLNEVEKLGAQLPSDITGTHSFIARDQIVGACLAAKRNASQKRERITRELASAKAKLPELEARRVAIEAEAGSENG
jgi:hypothetical protein